MKKKIKDAELNLSVAKEILNEYETEPDVEFTHEEALFYESIPETEIPLQSR